MNIREKNESEFLALLLNKPELLDVIQIKPKQLYLKYNQTTLEYAIECYSRLGYVDINDISSRHKDYDINEFLELWTNTLYYETNYQEQLKNNQEKILQFYKEDLTNYLNAKYKDGQLPYEEYTEKIKNISEISIVNGSDYLTSQEILSNINLKNTRIHLKNFKRLDETLELVKNDFLIIGATTGTGKSGFMLNLMNDLMEDYQCIYFNLEMSKSTIYKRIISINAEIPINSLSNPSDNQKKLMNQALDKIQKSKIIVDNKTNNIKTLKTIIAKYKDNSKHTIVFIDHIGLLKYDTYSNKSIYEQSTEIAKKLRQISMEYDCTIISASQLNRTAYSTGQITLSMLKDSGEVENSSSKIILLSLDKDSNKDAASVKILVDVAKNRDGRTGVMTMDYHKTSQVFKEIEKWKDTKN